MKVILKENLPKLGVAGEVCEVKKGYAKNYLLPNNLAILATPANLTKIENQKKEIVARKAEELKKFEKQLKEISGIILKIKVSVGEKQEMFAAIHEKDIAEVLEKEHGIRLNPDFINLTAPIKDLGEYVIEVDFGEGLKTNFQLLVSKSKS